MTGGRLDTGVGVEPLLHVVVLLDTQAAAEVPTEVFQADSINRATISNRRHKICMNKIAEAILKVRF